MHISFFGMHRLAIGAVAMLALGSSSEAIALDCKITPRHPCCMNPVCIPALDRLLSGTDVATTPGEIDIKNVRKLQRTWQLDTRSLGGKSSTAGMPPILHNERLYIDGADGVGAFDLKNPDKPLWKYPRSGSTRGVGAADNERLYISLDDSLIALDAGTGKPSWSKKAPSGTSAIVIDQNLLQLHASDGWTTSLEAGNGGDTGNRLMKSFVAPPPMALLGSDRRVVVTSLHRNQLNAFDAQTGKDLWKATLPSKPISISSFQNDGRETVVVVTEDRKISAYTLPSTATK